ncbi:hypothetical protein J2Z43_001212 [Clostridioides mangenotii]|uniref:Uncharacterized protein n=1 Tax=Metaclostridioides mangenotii TaxID=1540 RepID=A0ABS4EA58_9FIRM|nr:hypothetical protein [Clostridioides mangenotii]
MQSSFISSSEKYSFKISKEESGTDFGSARNTCVNLVYFDYDQVISESLLTPN